MSKTQNPGALADATGESATSPATAAGCSENADSVRKSKGGTAYDTTPYDGGDGGSFVIRVEGRQEWTLRALIEAGPTGVTPIDRLAPRWSDYVFRLRKLGVPIETIWHEHGGEYSGKHGIYVLHADVEPAVAEVAA